ncbi:hypothetical protein ACI2TT_14915 [Ralstonia nicotianae]
MPAITTSVTGAAACVRLSRSAATLSSLAASGFRLELDVQCLALVEEFGVVLRVLRLDGVVEADGDPHLLQIEPVEYAPGHTGAPGPHVALAQRRHRMGHLHQAERLQRLGEREGHDIVRVLVGVREQDARHRYRGLVRPQLVQELLLGIVLRCTVAPPERGQQRPPDGVGRCRAGAGQEAGRGGQAFHGRQVECAFREHDAEAGLAQSRQGSAGG